MLQGASFTSPPEAERLPPASRFQDNPETRRRQLGIRTYKVIPLTPRDGLLEWVEQTIPLASYLMGSNRAVRRLSSCPTRVVCELW